MKRITVKQFMLCLALVVSFLNAKAQVVSCYLPSDIAVDAGSTFTVDVRVDSFIDVGGLGISVNWDPTILLFKEASNGGLELNELSGFNEVKAESEGKLGFGWVASSAVTGITLPDSTVLFSISFDVIGAPQDTTSLRFTDDPIFSEFYTLEPAILPATFSGAFVNVTGTSNTYYNSAPEIISLYPPVPNPFYENTLIKIDLQKAAQTSIKIIDQTGRLLYEDQQFLSAGLQNIPISKEIFNQSGTYYCLLNANEFRVMQKLVFIDR
ncbi:cohesin domain-containing protein [Flavilitoribacter nigricans]|uniref:Cohesin domain-containing protein n=1 Tax=Flavilitoribacter nigricans (strain ATCC 23147 / DSM 23189 / NBRC 102662 / NCIMB 1420 / SS-2) TaxID=1122177 RepID=A0A2D0NEI1_FLAN2|nr:cohesin domain-containing protein [Flavilitoribacter nigricans]PHN06877.1 hypothetical protein CRP01_09140 [Flavilitoribacter nigricans DSM 23189 = NBRC 102662]